MSFLSEYFDVIEDKTEVAVCCPFEHYTANGLPYQETNPSAHINTVNNLFHCKVCDQGYSEAQFIQKILKCKFNDAKRIQRCFETSETHEEWVQNTHLSLDTKARCLKLGISESVINELEIRTADGTTDIISFPVFMYGHLMDVRNYNPGGSPKIRSRINCPTGLIIPFDLWTKTSPNHITLLCAGEKDMAIARSHGFNAITLTGGENTLPRQLSYFANRKVAICYDNDGAGVVGANKLATELLKVTNQVKVITKFHEVCKEEHEDLTDFFVKYGKTKEDLIAYIKATPVFTPADSTHLRGYKFMDLLEASRPDNLNKLVQSNVQVVAISEATFACPSSAIAEKYKLANKDDTMLVGEFKEWELNDDNVENILHLMDNNFKEETIKENLREIMHVPVKERCVSLKIPQQVTVFKCYVTDMFETSNTSTTQPMEYTAYSITNKLESGQKYLVTYKIVPHPYKGQQLVMLIVDAKQANDSVTNFQLTEQVKTSLQTIIDLPGAPDEKIHLLIEKIKGLLGYNGNNTLISIIDLAFHTPLQFHFGNFQNVRAYLDTIIVGESRTGKSSTAETLRQLYGLGTFTSLAGNSATIPGLVGGSNKTASGYQTRAGIIPQNHRGLVIFEEFGKSNNSVITELTDIRSSNEVRITRVAGTITLPAMVRMISLTNPKNVNGQIKSVASYPNGIAVLTELVTAAEDIARYDLICILADKGASKIDPLWQPDTPLDAQVYRDRIRWVWSRSADQIVIDRETSFYIIERANALNEEYDGHIKIFGTETWKKLSRLAIAIAGYVVSTDPSYQNIIVRKEHVDLAEKILVELYDNSTFNLKSYITNEKKYTQIDDEGVALLQNIYDKHPMLILQLEQCASTSRPILMAATGLTSDELHKALNLMTRGLFIKYNSYEIIPTERFRLGLGRLNRNTFVSKVGENYAQV